jgi:tetratricopeptide (TPR) repeat protein
MMTAHDQDLVLAAETAHEALALAALRDAGSRSARSGGAARAIVDDVASRMFADESPPPEASQIGRFERPTMISYGGMGVVHRAFDPMLGRPVAIKLCRPDRPHRERDYQRLLVEARTLATLDHPNVVAVHEAGRLPDGQLYIALEYVEGEDLARWLTRPRPWRDVVAAYVQAAHGLAAVHRRGLVHRDIKPANILRRPDGAIKLIDFGLVKETPSDDPPDATSVATSIHTETGRVLGTRGFLAPELFLGAAPSVASDVFALCVAIYIGLYNRRPFTGMLRAHTSRAATRPRASSSPSAPPVLGDILGPLFEPTRGERGVPRHVVAAVRRGLSADPRARFQSVDALISALTPGPARPITLLVAAALSASLAGAAWARADQPAACSAVADEIADVWTPERRALVQTAFQRGGLAHADTAFAAVDRQLAAHLAEWTDVRAAACRARLDRRESPAALDARTACLDRGAQQLRAAVARLTAIDPQAIHHAPEQLAALPSPRDCEAPQIAAQACHAVPEDPDLRAAAARVDAQIADARAAQIAGDFTVAIDLAESAVHDADALDLRGLQAQARLALGDALRVAGRDRRATAVLLAARDLAQEVVCVDVLADTLSRLNKIAALSGGTDVAVADERVDQQRSLARALGPAHARIADADHERALVALHLHADADAAASAFTAAIDVRLHLPHLDAHQYLALADSHLGLASALARQSQPAAADEALRQSIAYRAIAVGDTHPSMYKPYLNWGHRLLERGEYVPAEAAYTRALTLASGHGATSRERTRVLSALAILAERRGDLTKALTHARAAAGSLDDQATNVDWDAVENLAQILTDIGEPAAALPLLERTLAERDHAADGLARGGTRTRLADAYNAADQPEKALEQASLALTDLRGRGSPIATDLAHAHFSRGEALVALADGGERLNMPAHTAADAVDSLREAIHIWTLRGDNPERLAWSRWHLARVLCEAQRSEAPALAAAAAARDHFATRPDDPDARQLHDTIDLWLRTSTCT